MLRVAICDDEPLALDRLSSLVAECPQIELAGAFSSGIDLLNALFNCAPDLVLLDIEMEPMNGFDVAHQAARLDWAAMDAPPLIIFVTDHPRFALASTDSGAIGFLNKPVERRSLERCVRRAQLARNRFEQRQRLRHLASQLEDIRRLYAVASSIEHVCIRRIGQVTRVPIQSIEWIEGVPSRYVRVHCSTGSHLKRSSLRAMAEYLDAVGFLRIHNSSVVSTQEIECLEDGPWNTIIVRLRSGKRLPVSRKYRGPILSMRFERSTPETEW